MLAKVKSPVFIDALQLELKSTKGRHLLAVLKDVNGRICSSLKKDVATENEQFTWTGLNDLPYGTYTLELSHEDEPDRYPVTMSVVKRV